MPHEWSEPSLAERREPARPGEHTCQPMHAAEHTCEPMHAAEHTCQPMHAAEHTCEPLHAAEHTREPLRSDEHTRQAMSLAEIGCEPTRSAEIAWPARATDTRARVLSSAIAGTLVGPARPRRRAFPLTSGGSEASATRRRTRRRANAGWIGRALLATFKLGLVTFIAYGLMFNFSVVRGSSMSPGIHDGDRILVNHFSYVFQDVRRGDIVVLQYPLDPNLDYIKRVIGLPGDDVRIADGRVFVNGQELDEPYVSSVDPNSRLIAHVQPEHYFVLGDNRPHSSDSREFGLVPRENLRGKVDVRVWPPSRAGTLH